MPDVVRPHDDRVEEVPGARIVDVLDDELADEVVRVVAVAVQEGGKQAEKLQLLKVQVQGYIFALSRSIYLPAFICWHIKSGKNDENSASNPVVWVHQISWFHAAVYVQVSQYSQFWP